MFFPSLSLLKLYISFPLLFLLSPLFLGSSDLFSIPDRVLYGQLTLGRSCLSPRAVGVMVVVKIFSQVFSALLLRIGRLELR
jgi:hypothetical protein